MASRTWLAVILACAIWFGYLKWFAPPMPQSTPPTTQSTGQTPAGTPAAATSQAGLFGKIPATTSTQKFTSANIQVDLSDMGGRIEEVRMARWHVTPDLKSEHVKTLGPRTTPYSLMSFFTDTALQDLAYEKYEAKSQNDQVVYERKSPAGVSIVKTYQFDPSSYWVDTVWVMKFNDSKRNDWGSLVVPLGSTNETFEANEPLRYLETVAYQNESVTRTTINSLDEGEKVMQGTTGWLAYGNRYFATALVPNSAINPDVVLHKSPSFSGGYLRFPLVLKPGQNELVFKFRIFTGPKDHSLLAAVPGLKQLVDFGWFAFLAYPLLESLGFLHKYFHNWGVAIILMTLLVRIIFYPLSLKSFKSMRSMQKLQPQLNALKEKYKDDKQKFTQEQLALFKAHKVNPAGGCLPMLVQLPVLIAFYQVLANSIELFHAPFFGWITDLSTKDPYYVTPILMGGAMFAQQKLTPTVGMDPTQAKMMLLMPVVFTFMMISLPSGLTVYMFISTLLGIIQQYAMTREPNAAKVVSSGVAPEKNG